MKTIKARSNVGAGLFTDEPLDIRIEFPDNAAIELQVIAITNDMVADFYREGIKFGDYADPLEAIEHGTKVFDRIARDPKYIKPDGEVVELVGKYKDRIMQMGDVMAGIFEAAAEHGYKLTGEDEGNSES